MAAEIIDFPTTTEVPVKEGPVISYLLSLPLDPSRFGYKEWSEESVAVLQKQVEEGNGHLIRTLGAVAAIHKPKWPAPEGYLKKFDTISVGVDQDDEGVPLLKLDNLPADSFQATLDGAVIPGRTVDFLQSVLADAVRSDWTVKERMTAAGLIGENEGARYRTFIQGGHTVPAAEYNFAKTFGYDLGNLFGGDLELMTGCGPGVMEGPFKGLIQAYCATKQFHKRIGLTELGILAKEAPNGALSDLVMFPNIEERMEAFIRAAQFGIALRGGAGTMEEILVFAGIMSHEDNAKVDYPFYLFEPKDGQPYLKSVVDFLNASIGPSVSKLFTWHAGTPKDCVSQIDLNEKLREQCKPGHFNEDIVVPPGFLKPFEANREDFENLILSRDVDSAALLQDLRRLFSGIVTVTVKDPARSKAFRQDRPQIAIDPILQNSVQELLLQMQEAKRIPHLPTKGDGSLDLPFEFVRA